MDKNDLFVPLFAWLLGGSRIGGGYNRYYGSCTQNAAQAAFGQKVFNYTICIEKLDETEVLKAAVYFGLQSFKNTDPDEIVEKTFDCAPESLPQVKAWLTAQRNEYFSE